MDAINWNEPIEAVHTDGRVVAVTMSRVQGDVGVYRIAPALEGRFWAFNCDGAHCSGSPGWSIRNVQPAVATLRTSDECLTRMERLVERMAANHSGGDWPDYNEARAIVALLDPDKAEAIRIYEDSPYTLVTADEALNNYVRAAILAGIKRGRELAAAGK